MALARRSRFLYGDSGDYTTPLPVTAWLPAETTVGGSRVAGSGVPASYMVRRDGLIDLTLRFEEGGWPDVLALVQFGQTAESFLWQPDALGTEAFAVYLDIPAPGAKWAPTRDGQNPRLMLLTLTLRLVDGSSPWLAYF